MSFTFTQENLVTANAAVAKYPSDRSKSAVMELLYIAQEQNQNWISQDAICYIADFLKMPVVKVLEIATFYTMYNLKPVGKYVLQVCGTTPCELSGSNILFDVCYSKLGIRNGETSKDGLFTLHEVECLGACANAPLLQINNQLYYENLTKDAFEALLDELANKV